MDKCFNKKCEQYNESHSNNCAQYNSYLGQVCETHVSEATNIINNLNIELESVKKRNKVLERALDLACDDLHSSLEFNYGYADEDLVNHFITKAKEANK